MPEVNIFTFLNQIQNKKRTEPYDKKIASGYMLSMWLSHEMSLIDIVCDIMKYRSMFPDEVIYEYFMDRIPRGRRFIKWTKKRKDSEDLKKEIEELKIQYPELSDREGKMILSYMKELNCKEDT